MRRLIYSLLIVAVSVTGFVSCKKTNPQYAPYISFSVFLRNPVFSHDSIVGCQDTISLTYDESSGFYLADTLLVKDTVLFLAGFGSRGNDLVSVSVSIPADAFKTEYSVTDDIRSKLTDDSTPEEGKLSFVSGYNYVMFPMKYVALQSGVYKFVFNVVSDSDYSPLSVTVVQPVKEAAAQ